MTALPGAHEQETSLEAKFQHADVLFRSPDENGSLWHSTASGDDPCSTTTKEEEKLLFLARFLAKWIESSVQGSTGLCGSLLTFRRSNSLLDAPIELVRALHLRLQLINPLALKSGKLRCTGNGAVRLKPAILLTGDIS